MSFCFQEEAFVRLDAHSQGVPHRPAGGPEPCELVTKPSQTQRVECLPIAVLTIVVGAWRTPFDGSSANLRSSLANKKREVIRAIADKLLDPLPAATELPIARNWSRRIGLLLYRIHGGTAPLEYGRFGVVASRLGEDWRHELFEEVFHRRHDAHDLVHLTLLGNPRCLIARQDQEDTLAGLADAAQGCTRVFGELLGSFARVGGGRGDHGRLHVVEPREQE